MSFAISSEQEPSRLIVPGFYNPPGQHDGLAEQRLDILGLDPVLSALGPVAGVPVEILGDALQRVEPRGRFRIVDEAHSYCIAIAGWPVKDGLQAAYFVMNPICSNEDTERQFK